MNLRSNRFALGVVVLLHFVLAMAFAFDTPYCTPGRYFSMGGTVIPDIGAPDELQHVNYIQWLADGKGFPVLDPKDPQLGLHYQSHQPPLYYILATGVAKATGQHDLHLKMAGLILRTFNVLIGCANVVGIFFLGFWAFKRRDVGLCAAAFAALLPMNLALSGAISNDPLLFCLCTWCLALTANALRNGWTMKRGLIIGLLMGLAFLTKTTAIMLPPAILIAIFFSGGLKPSGKVFWAAAALALVIALPWWLRNQSLYGDPFAMKAFNQAFVNSPTKNSIHADWGKYLSLEWMFGWRSFIGVFGYMDIFMPDTVYAVAGIMLIILGIGGLLSPRRKELTESKVPYVLNGAFLVLVFLSYAAFNVKYFQAQARYLFPAIGPISVLFGLGIIYYSREKWKTSFISYVVVMTALNLWIVQQFVPSEFAQRLLPVS